MGEGPNEFKIVVRTDHDLNVIGPQTQALRDSRQPPDRSEACALTLTMVRRDGEKKREEGQKKEVAGRESVDVVAVVSCCRTRRDEASNE